jgi:hypothetical protein
VDELLLLQPTPAPISARPPDIKTTTNKPRSFERMTEDPFPGAHCQTAINSTPHAAFCNTPLISNRFRSRKAFAVSRTGDRRRSFSTCGEQRPPRHS